MDHRGLDGFLSDVCTDKPFHPGLVACAEMAALAGRAVLDALIDPKFQAELPEELRDQIKRQVAEAGPGTYGQITVGFNAKAVREAAQRLEAKPHVSKKLAAALQQLARIPGY